MQVPLRAGAKAGAPSAAGKPSLGEGLEAVSTRDWSDEKAADSNGEACACLLANRNAAIQQKCCRCVVLSGQSVAYQK